MQRVIPLRLPALALAAVLTLAAASATTALFRAPAPGAELNPVGDAETVISLVQGEHTLLWTTLSGNVTSYLIQGWPSETADAELGGALVIERPSDGTAGVIDFGERPMLAEFTLEG